MKIRQGFVSNSSSSPNITVNFSKVYSMVLSGNVRYSGQLDEEDV